MLLQASPEFFSPSAWHIVNTSQMFAEWMNDSWFFSSIEYHLSISSWKCDAQGFPGGAVVENLAANAGDTGSSPGLGRSHMPRSN